MYIVQCFDYLSFKGQGFLVSSSKAINKKRDHVSINFSSPPTFLRHHVLRDRHEIAQLSDVVMRSSGLLEKHQSWISVLVLCAWPSEPPGRPFFSTRLKVMRACQNKTDVWQRNTFWHLVRLSVVPTSEHQLSTSPTWNWIDWNDGSL